MVNGTMQFIQSRNKIGQLLFSNAQGLLELDNFYQQAATDQELPLDAMRNQPSPQNATESARAPAQTEGETCRFS